MAFILIPTRSPCPSSFGDSAAKWHGAAYSGGSFLYSDVCGRAMLQFGVSTASGYTFATLQTTFLGVAYQTKINAIPYSCAGYALPAYHKDISSAGNWGNYRMLDIWQAYDDGQWSSSVAIDIKVSCSNVIAWTHRHMMAACYLPPACTAWASATPVVDASKTPPGVAPSNCDITNAASWTMTVYDDGTISVA